MGVRRWWVAGLGMALAASGVGRANADGDARVVLLAGDSMMRAVARALPREMARVTDARVVSMVSLGSGLARYDLYDWPARLAEAVRETPPAVAVLFFGANDVQPMQTADGVLAPDAPDWAEEYRRRAGALIDQAVEAGAAAVFWIGLPDMRTADMQEKAARIRPLIIEACAARPRAVLVDTVPLLSRAPGEYSAYLYDARGLPVQVRDGDGVHLNRQGAERLVQHLVPLLVQALAVP